MYVGMLPVQLHRNPTNYISHLCVEMSNDASLPPNAPIINGLDIQHPIHGEEDASPSSATISRSTSSLETVCKDLHGRVSAFLKRPPDSDMIRRVQEQTRVSIDVIEKALKDYECVQPFQIPGHCHMRLTSSSFSSLSLSYNGGKDCLVLLILYLSTLYAHFRTSIKPTFNNTNAATRRTAFPTSIPSIYAQSPDPFPAITNFVTTSSKHYHLDLCTIPTNPRPGQHYHHQNPNPNPNPTPEKRITIRDAFATYLSLNNSTHPKILAIFVGTRRTDPHGANLTHFDRTDHGWPDFMRIHPVIDWRLSEIWCFLRADELREADGSSLAYCEMYDEGYTSLGGVGDTLRNPRLRFVDQDGRERYRPAYELTEDGEERLGRD
jgi:FAD synthetase